MPPLSWKVYETMAKNKMSKDILHCNLWTCMKMLKKMCKVFQEPTDGLKICQIFPLDIVSMSTSLG